MNKLKVVGIAYLLIGLIFIPFAIQYQVMGAYTGLSPVIMPGTQVKPYTYCIWKQGSTYYATNSLTGAIDYSGTNAGQVINSGIQATGDIGGGTVFLKGDNTFNIGSTTIVMNRTRVNLIGEGMSSLITTSNNVPLITITRPVDNPNVQIIRDLALVGPGYTNTNAHAFNISRSFYNIIENIYVSDVRDVFHCIETEYLTVRNVHAEPLSEWGFTGECWRGIYLDNGTNPADDGGMVFFEECFFYRPRCTGVLIQTLEIGRFHRVIVAEPGYGDVAGSDGIGFKIVKPNSYTTFDACESDTTHGDAWHINAASLHFAYLTISNCFGFTKPESTGRAIFINSTWGVRITGGEFRSDQNHVIEIVDSYFVEIGNCELRAHNRLTDPGTYFDGILLDNAENCRLHDFHLQTAHTATGKTGILATNTCYGTQIVNANLYGTGGNWPTLINVPEVYVEALDGFSYQTSIPTEIVGDGTKVAVYSGGNNYLYIRINGAWVSVALT